MLKSLNDIKKRIDESNIAAAGNRSNYPIQEQVTLLELWEQVECECPGDCFCKKHGCTFHWRLKPNPDFNDIVNGFVRSYIDVLKHKRFYKCLEGEAAPSVRIKEAVSLVRQLRDNWEKDYSNALKSNSCILCDDNISEYWQNKFSELDIDKSIYPFKMLSIFLPDIAVPFDVKARSLFKKELGLGSNENYLTLINSLRAFYRDIIERDGIKIDNFRRLDDPGISFDFARQDISLGKAGYYYGKNFLPLERPFSRLLDKVFYRPDGKVYSDKKKLKESKRRVKGEKMEKGKGYEAGNANADKLFILFLKKIEKEYGINIPDSFLIEEVVKRIPREDTRIKNNSSYNYALIALFGSQKGRDYFLFEDISIQKKFTEEANNPLRDNYFWKNYLKTRVRINPKYLKKTDW